MTDIKKSREFWIGIDELGFSRWLSGDERFCFVSTDGHECKEKIKVREVIEGETNVCPECNREADKYKSLCEELAAALETSGSTNGIAKDFLEFHGRPSKELKNCQAMLVKHKELAKETLAKYREAIK